MPTTRRTSENNSDRIPPIVSSEHYDIETPFETASETPPDNTPETPPETPSETTSETFNTDIVNCVDCNSRMSRANDEVFTVGFVSWACEECYNENYFFCHECDGLHHNDNSFIRYGHSFCESCYDEREDNYDCDDYNYLRKPQLIHKEYVKNPNKAGQIIKSPRLFGIELEVIGREEDEIYNFSKKLPKQFGIVTDSSIDDERGIEIVTPILAGLNGEKAVRNVSELLKKYNFYTDKSCGFHCHLDGRDFRMNEKTVIKDRRKAKNVYYAPSDFLLDEQIVQKRLVSLMLFYSIFDDVILAMIPKSRRTNTFCKTLKDDFHFTELITMLNNTVNRYSNIEMLWYRADNYGRVEEQKADRWDGTRYHGINIHSLFGKRKTIEIRYHGGTINGKKILQWVSLHQHILDTISNTNRFDNQFIGRIRRTVRFPKKVELFLEVIGCEGTAISKYVRARIDIFAKPEKLCVE